MNRKVQLSKDQRALLYLGTKIVVNGGDITYHYLPFWFKSTEEEGIFECFDYGHAPKELIDFINKEREYDERRDKEGK